MAKHLRYYGEFATIEGHSVRVAIYQESDTAFTPEEVRFPADSPLVIEWGEVEKYDVVCGSSATLKIISPSDRKFVDLYTVRYGDVRLEVFRDGKLYWCGCIDTELYEEPYERLDGYDVTLTFTDLGNLERVPFDVEIGFRPIKELLTLAMIKTQCIKMGEYAEFNDDFEESFATQYAENIDWSRMLLSTTYGNNLEVIQNAYVRTDNFYDETGEPMSWKEVVEGILQPLGVRLIQVAGLMMLYDFEGLATASKTHQLAKHDIYWTSDHQDFSIDKTYNNIKITWSPYAQTQNLLPDKCWDEANETPRNKIALNSDVGLVYGNARYWTYPLELSDGPEFLVPGFTLWKSTQCKNITLGIGRSVFKTVGQYDGDESEGVVAFHRAFYKYTDPDNNSYGISNRAIGVNPISQWSVTPAGSIAAHVLFSMPAVIVPPQSDVTPMQLRLKMECLVDCRINCYEEPFGYVEGSDDSTCSSAMTRFNKRAQFLFIPVRVLFKPAGSDKEYVYDNTSTFANVTTFYRSMQGKWVSSASSQFDASFCYLAYYITEPDQRREGTALCKWVANRQAVGVHGKTLDATLANLEDGQYIPFPDLVVARAGEVRIEVMDMGWRVARYDSTPGSSDHIQYTEHVKNDVTFAMLKLPSLELVKQNIFDDDISDKDIVYNAEVNPDAQEELELHTICGTAVDGVPSARGAYYDEIGRQITQMRRGGRTATAEELLCGTLYSQYADRHVCLTGECRVDTERYLSFFEDNQWQIPNIAKRQFLCVSEADDLREDTADCKYVEFNTDNYDRR